MNELSSGGSRLLPVANVEELKKITEMSSIRFKYFIIKFLNNLNCGFESTSIIKEINNNYIIKVDLNPHQLKIEK